MKKKDILVIAPILPQLADMAPIERTLAFLKPYYHLDFLDPLSVVNEALDNDAYYVAWQQQMARYLTQYEAFIGFSFGGVILQQCFPLFANNDRPIILCSTPTFADQILHQKLGAVIELLKKSQVEQALSVLYSHVFYPFQQPQHNWGTLDREKAANRLIVGLTRVLSTDSSQVVKTTTVNHLHLIGERSNLINMENVSSPKTGLLLTVPGAGMRVLQDNVSFCKKVIMKKLNCEPCK